MATRAVAERWLSQLTHIPTAPGKEAGVARWVTAWVSRRPDLSVRVDLVGNLLISQKDRKRRTPVVAVAHMDHPGFVVEEVDVETVRFQFLGHVDPEYFESARVEFGNDKQVGSVVSYDPDSGLGIAELDEAARFGAGELGLWQFGEGGPGSGRYAAPACDDLAGVAASLAALDRARSNPEMRHFSVLLTRGEEIGFVGAIGAARHGTLRENSRILSIETSPELPEARIGDGPIIRVGDRLTMYDREMTNLITEAARVSGIRHQRKLMAGGACEATAFGVSGYRSSGLCVALANHHNRGNLIGVLAGTEKAVPMLEEIALEDFHGLVDLILVAVAGLDESDQIPRALDRIYESNRHHLG